MEIDKMKSKWNFFVKHYVARKILRSYDIIYKGITHMYHVIDFLFVVVQ